MVDKIDVHTLLCIVPFVSLKICIWNCFQFPMVTKIPQLLLLFIVISLSVFDMNICLIYSLLIFTSKTVMYQVTIGYSNLNCYFCELLMFSINQLMCLLNSKKMPRVFTLWDYVDIVLYYEYCNVNVYSVRREYQRSLSNRVVPYLRAFTRTFNKLSETGDIAIKSFQWKNPMKL